MIEVRNLTKHYKVSQRTYLSLKKVPLKAVNDVSFTVREGKTLAIIGESGCGKTSIAKLVLRLEVPTNGRILFEDKDIKHASKVELKQYRRAVQAVFQNPYASLNPRMRVRDIVAEPIVANRLLSRKKTQERTEEVLKQVGLSSGSLSLYPHEFSGGQRQRIALARALASKPRFLVLDEPVSALDLSIRAQVMNLLKELQETLGLGYLLISHDLATAIHLSHRVAVVYAGKIVESISTEAIHRDAFHPYTQALFKAASLKRVDIEREFVLHGEVPDPLNLPSGCCFHPRCSKKTSRCCTNEPPLNQVGKEHSVRCHLFQ